MHRERVDDDGHTIGYATDEVPLRAIWAHYLGLMNSGPMKGGPMNGGPVSGGAR
jgi:fatty-acyl-CoA synthase